MESPSASGCQKLVVKRNVMLISQTRAELWLYIQIKALTVDRVQSQGSVPTSESDLRREVKQDFAHLHNSPPFFLEQGQE